jgi:hypothetical protein
MNKALYALGAASTLALASPGYTQVVTTTDQTTGTPLTDTIHESTSNSTDNASTVYGSTTQPGWNSQNVTFTGGTSQQLPGSTGDSHLGITDGGGFASLTDASNDGALNLWSVVINPDQLFTDMKFAVQLTGEGTFDVYYLLSGAVSYVDAATFSTDNKGNTNYLIDVTGGTFDAIQIVANGPNASLFEIKQISINTAAAVPEPATWGMMLLGFWGIGMGIRYNRRRNGNELLAQIA